MYATDPAISDDNSAFAGNVPDSFRYKDAMVLKRTDRNLSLKIGRVVDMMVAIAVLLAVLPVLALLCCATWLQDGANPIFVHRRIGLGGRSFPCLKIRTMVRDADARLRHLLETDPAAAAEWTRDQKLRCDPRITPFGAFLRKSSLDELPQLLNVIAGHMSLVGPRPIVQGEVARYGRYFRHYCLVRPGITGLWQVSGRNDTSYRRRVAIDTVYSRSKTVLGDLAIIGRTVPALMLSRGSY
ncbi:sugar transferase [Sphingomonas sp. KC8]|nr:sugar transferase [Sphingomonas sp. KC8]